VVRAVVDKPEEREHPRPGVPRAGQTVAAARRGFLQFLEQAGQAVGAMVEGIVARQQLARLGEEHDHRTHHDAHGGAVDVGRIDAGALLLQDLTVALHKQLDRLAHALAKDGRQLGLPLAAVEDGFQQRGRRRGRQRCPQLG